MHEFSSYREYIGDSNSQITDTGMALSMLGLPEFIRYTLTQNDDAFRVIIKQGVAVNQAARLTGWSRPVIRRAIEKA